MSASSAAGGWAVYRRLLGYLRRFRLHFAVAVFGMALYAFAEMQMARFVEQLVDRGFLGGDAAVLRGLLGVLALIVLGRALGLLLSTYFMGYVGRGVIRALRRDMFERLLRLPVAFYERSSTGDLTARFSYHVEQVAEAISNVVVTLVQDSLLVVFLIGYMFYTNAALASVLFVLVPLAALVIVGVSSRFRKASRRIQQSVGRVNHIVHEAVDGHQVVKLFGGEEKEAAALEEANAYNFRQHLRLTLLRALSTAFIQLSAGLGLGVVVYLAASGWVGEVSPGVFAAFIVAMARMAPPLRHLTNINAQLQKGIAAAASLFELLDEPPERDQGGRRLRRARGEIEYRDVVFAYDPAKGTVLDGVSFRIEPGQTVALVGRSGSGKSTIAKLLARFYEPQSGRILLDGVPITEYRLRDLRDQIAFVGQHVTLFNDTIANNIAYGANGPVDRARVLRAAEAAYCMGFVERLPEGLDTLVGEDGVRLSGGQRQRLAIARALYRDAPILILDEATSALDSESEQKVQAALANLMANRTTLVIAHRLSTVERADRILVVDGGRVVESGSHRELLAQGGQYASLHALQFNLGAPPSPRSEAEDGGEGDSADLPTGQDFLSDRPLPGFWERLWYGAHPLAQLLAPLGSLFGLLVGLRRALYRRGWLKVERFPAPVVVVGNITVGGTGKTPLVLWLARHLARRGRRPGIVSRGYRGRAKRWPVVVDADTPVAAVGDEARLLFERSGCPVVVGPDRAAAVRELIARFDCDVVLSDDGLQHYRMGRDIEIVVVDGTRGFGNGLLLPAGPMREPKVRLKSVDFIVTNGARLPGAWPMQVKGDRLVNLADGETGRIEDWRGLRVHAVAALGNPERFFDALRAAGLQPIEHRFRDHHEFTVAELTFDDPYPVITTEKDAVKLRPLLDRLDGRRFWYLPVEAKLPEAFARAFDQRLEAIDAQRRTARMVGVPQEQGQARVRSQGE
ncbi:MAG: hypothetical protein KatS3mg121_1546 [Gammaproteobacteria bacterium]|nr:MAG: hypothetical protein KatS3mg121_1546 [Gammaproteobacteria bacterium]